MTGNRYAILIASSKFQFQNQDLQNLKCPENDVDGLYELLTSKDYGDFSKEIPPLKNKPLTEIKLAIEKVLTKIARKDDLVLIYYSGHGKPDSLGGLNLVSTDTDPEYLRTTALPFEFLKTLILDSKTNKVIIILDCCYSGLAGKYFAKGGLDDQLKLVSGARGTYVMTSSTGLQQSWEKESEKYGVFTKHIIEGIRDGTAANDDGEVTILNLYDYVYRQMQIEGKQTPMMCSLNTIGDLVITSKGRPGKGEISRLERGKKIANKLNDPSSTNILSDRIFKHAVQIILSEPEELSEVDRLYDSLLGQFLLGVIDLKALSNEWDRIEDHQLITEAKQEPISTSPRDNRVFISYSRKDENFALRLAANLKKLGVPIWLDQWDIPSGANWNRTIEKALNECTHLLAIVSPSSVDSDEVQSEWLSALEEKKIVIPILYQPCRMPFRLRSIQYINFTSLSPDDISALNDVLAALGKTRRPDTNLSEAISKQKEESAEGSKSKRTFADLIFRR